MSAVSELMPPEWDTTAMPARRARGVGPQLLNLKSSAYSWTRSPYWQDRIVPVIRAAS